MTRLVLGLSVLLAAALAWSDVGEGEVAVKHTRLSSTCVAGFAVALDAHREWSKTQGIVLTATELTRRHWAVHLVEDGSTLTVRFLPESTNVRGGGVAYRIDLKRMEVVGQDFER